MRLLSYRSSFILVRQAQNIWPAISSNKFHFKFAITNVCRMDQKLMSQKINSMKAIVIFGPSGSGKTTLVNMLLSHFENSVKYSVSHTTRKPRKGEIEGKSYYFVDKQNFEKMISNNQFIEYCNFSGNYYGTSYQELYRNALSGLLTLLDVDIHGVLHLKSTNLPAKYIYIKPPSIEFLEQNLRKRGSESDETIKIRLEHALKDMKMAENIEFDLIVVNDDLKFAFEKLKQFIQKVI